MVEGMNWTEAIEAMKRGAQVRRTQDARREPVFDDDGDIAESGIGEIRAPVVFAGTEPMRLAAAWSADGKPVSVFQGAWSGVLFVPDDDRAATDWEVVG